MPAERDFSEVRSVDLSSPPSLTSSEGGDTAFSDDFSEVTDDMNQSRVSSVTELSDDERRSSINTLDGSTDDCSEQPDLFQKYLRLAPDSGWQQIKKTPEPIPAPLPTTSAEELENEFQHCLTVRRATSLKTYKTPPGSPHRKKEVRFADALGLDLESVGHIISTTEPPIVPASATRHLKIDSNGSSTSRRRILHPCFPEPGLSPNFAARVAERCVALRSFRVDYDIISGTVCVANIAYEKRVIVRYTFDSWSTYSDVNAIYVDGSNTGSTDLFRFNIQLPEPCGTWCSFVEFSIMYMAGTSNEIYWDSNFGSNYRVDIYFQ